MIRSNLIRIAVLALPFLAPLAARAEVLAASHIDFSTTAQSVGGWEYGYYKGTNDTAGEFTTAGMTAGATGWNGDQGFSTPAHDRREIHPGTGSSGAFGPRSAVVRRYTVGSNWEPTFSGNLRIVGRFFDGNTGDTSVFIAVDLDGDGGAEPRVMKLPVPAGQPGPLVSIDGPATGVSFDIVVNVIPGTTIDFGAVPHGSGDSDSTGFFAYVVDATDTAVPTHLVANAYSSVNWTESGATDYRGFAHAMVTDGILGETDGTSFDTTPGTGFPYQHAGLLYLEQAGSGKATRFDSVRIDVTTSADFSDTPRLYLLRKNVDPNRNNPAADDRYVRMAVAPARFANSVGQPYYEFDLSALTEGERTGYGFAVVGTGTYTGGSIAVSEISAQAVRVSDAGVPPVTPFWIAKNGHSYAHSLERGLWDQTEADAVAAGGHLVAINDTAEQTWLLRAFGTVEQFYIGLRQPTGSAEPTADFAWTTGEALTFQNWHSGEPNNFFGDDEDYTMMSGSEGKWGDVRNVGFPETGDYRGIIESNNASSGENHFQLGEIPAKSNIFDAGLANATQGGVLPPSIDLGAGTAGGVLTFPQVVGLLNTAADTSGPDGKHTAGRSVNLTGVGGISGYLNGNNTPALVGVFLGSNGQGDPVQPASQPARLDFSLAGLGENFEALAPALGQVFFIGDGFTNNGEAQSFIIPAGATRLYFGFPDGDNGTLYHGAPTGYGDNSGSITLRAVLTPSEAPFITTTDFPAPGGQLEAVGGTGPYMWSIFSGNLPPHLTLNPDGSVTLSGTARENGTFTFTVRATDDLGVTQDKEFTVVVADPIAPAGGLVAWYPGQNAVGDVVGGRHGSLKNGATFAAGKVGRGFSFDGTNDVIEIADHDSLDLTGDLTIEAWVNATATSGERTIVSKRSGDNNDVNYVFFTREGILRFATRGGGGSFADLSGGVAVPAGWSHVAVTVTGSTLRMFINGATVLETGSFSPARPAVAGPLTIGGSVIDSAPSSSPDGPWAGSIDEVTLYSRGLSVAEITAIYTAGAGGKARSDVAREFSATQNPGSVWSYRELSGGADLGSYVPAQATPMSTPGVLHTTVDFWSANASFSHHRGDNFLVIPSGGTQYDWVPDQFGWGPGPSGERPVARWTAPTAGRYAVSATFTGVDTLPGSTDVHIRHGSEALFDGIVNSYRGDGVSYTTTRNVAAGDTVDFILGINGDWRYDSSALAASVTFLGSLPQIVETEFPDDLTSQSIPWRLTATGGTGPYTFAIVSGALPGDIELEADGDITGELTEFGHFNFTVEVTDAAGSKGQRAYHIAVAQETATGSGITSWFPGELHPHDVIIRNPADTDFGLEMPGVTFVAGKVGRAMHFDGVDGAVEVQSADLNALPLTIEAWIKPELRTGGSVTQTTWATNIVSGDRANFGGHGLGVNVFPDGSQMRIELQTPNPADAFRTIPGVSFVAGQWAHVALVITSGNAKTYVNGALVDDFDYAQGAMDADPFFRIGRHNEDAGFPEGHRFFKGAIDELSTYNRALSAAEILAVYNADSLGKTRDDAARDFNTQTNEAGQLWQYGRMGTGLAPVTETFTRYTTVGSENTLRYWRDGAVTDPNVIKNRGDQPYLHWAAGELSVHPGLGPERVFSAVRWTAPAPGTYAAFAQFRRLNTQDGTVSVHMRRNGQSFPFIDDTILNGPGARAQFGASVLMQAGETIDFIVGSRDDFGFDATGISPSVVLLEGVPEPAAVTSLDIQTDLPAITLARWHFTATRAADASDVEMALQFSATPEVESSWVHVQTALGHTGPNVFTNQPAGSDVWTFDPLLSFAPGGYYFRVVQTAPGFATSVSGPFGNESLVGGSGEEGPVVIGAQPPPPTVTNLKITTAKPAAAGKKWSFQVDYAPRGVLLLVQYSLTPDDPNSWQYLPGDAQLKAPDIDGDGQDFWKLDVSKLSVPSGNLFFRIESTTSGLGGVSSYSAPFGAAALAGAKPGTTGAIAVKNAAALTIDAQAKLRVNNNDLEIPNGLVSSGDEIAYVLSFRNHGGAAASGITFSVMVPPQLELVSATGTTTPIRKKPSDPNSEIIGVKIDVGTLSPSPNFIRRTVVARVKADAKKPGRGVVNLLGTVLVESPDFPDQKLDLPFLAIADPLRVGLVAAGNEFSFSKGATIPLIFTAENKSAAALTDAVATVKIPAGAYLVSFLEDAQTDVERVFDKKTGLTIALTFKFGPMPAQTSRLAFIDIHTPFDTTRDAIFTGDPSKNDPGYTFTAYDAVKKKTLVAIGDGFSVNLTNNLVRPPQLDIGKDIEGLALNGRRTHGILFKAAGEKVERVVRGGIVTSGGEATFNVTFRNVGEGTAKAVEIRDDVPTDCTLIPESLELNGQPIASALGGTLKAFDAKNKPVGPNEANTDIRTARRFSVHPGDLGAGQGGVLTYRVVASSYSKGKLTPIDPGKTGRNIATYGGTIAFTESLTYGVIGSPDTLVLRVAKARDMRLTLFQPPGKARAGNQLRWAIRYENAGELPVHNCFLDVPIPVGTTASSATFVHLGTANVRAPQNGEDLSAFAGATGTPRIQLGTLTPGESREIAITLAVSSPLNATLDAAGEVAIFPRIDGYDSAPANGLRLLTAARAARAPAPKLVGAIDVKSLPPGTLKNVVPLARPSAPKPFIGRTVPLGATKGGTMDVVIFFGNAGDTAATGGDVAMQIPFETTFVSATPVNMTRPSDPANQLNVSDTRSTLTPRTEKKGSRIERIVVDLPTLPAHSTGCFTMTLQIAPKFGAAAVEDSSCRIKMAKCAEVVAIPFATQVRSAEWYFSVPESIAAAFTGFGSWVSSGFKTTVQQQFKDLNANSHFSSCAGLDVAVLKNGVIFAPTGFNRSLIIGPSNLVAAGGLNLVAAGGLNLVAAGGGNVMSVKNVPGFGTQTPSQLCANIPSLVAAGGLNLVAAGGGNLVGMDGATLVAAGGGNLVGLDGATLVGMDGATLVGMDGGTLATISSNGGSLTFTPVAGAAIAANINAAEMVAAGGGNIVAAGGGNLVAAGGGNMVAAGGGNMVAAGAGN